MEGVAAAAIGLLLIVALRGVRRASRSVAGTLALTATFVGVGLLHWPLLLVVAIVGPVIGLRSMAWSAGDAR